jgi:nanoRNase/pAp phosphatase (c-di-AMP/oligoRNAs hydrolase)
MDNLILQKVRDSLSANQPIGIMVGRNPGIDEMGSALSLYLALKNTGKNVSIVSPTDPIVEISSLVGIDKVKKSFEGESGDLTVSFPYREGEIEKISYTLENGKLNILVKAGEAGLTFNEKDIEYKRSAGVPGLIFTVGALSLSDLGSIFDPEKFKDVKIVNIDYKSENQGFGDMPLIDRNASSVSEMTASLMSLLNFEISTDIASNLLSGITSATENFQNPSTSSLAFEMAAVLMKKGAVRNRASGRQRSENRAPFAAQDMSRVQNQTVQNQRIRNINTQRIQSMLSQKPPVSTPNMNTSNGGQNIAPRVSRPSVDEDNPPDDWLAPKIYKGSTDV